jgi:hypothetical protein
MSDVLPSLVERDDRWILPFRGLMVTQVQVDYAFGLVLDDKGAVRVSNTATLGWVNVGAKPEIHELNPENQDVASGLVLVGATVLSAVAFKSGGLCIVFDDGHLLKVAPDPQYEPGSLPQCRGECPRGLLD